MKILFYSLISLILTSHLSLANDKTPLVTFDAGFKGLHVNDKFTKSRVLGLNGIANINYEVSQNLKAKVNAGVNFETGSNSSLFVSENEPESELILKEALIAYSPLESLQLSFGAIDQKHWKSPLWLTETAFLAAEEKLSLAYGDYQIYIKAMQAIPQNRPLSDRVGNVNEGTPTFFAESVGIHLGGDIMSFLVEGTQFSFDQLGSGVAQQSGLLGNSTTGNLENARFIYRYQGYNLASQLEVHLGDLLGLKLSGHYTFNDKAPDNRNTAFLVHGGVLLSVLELYMETFENQSDASVAYYNDKSYGHNNREGTSFGINWGGPEEELSMGARYTKANLILNDQNLSQADSQIISLHLIKTFSL